MLVFYPVDMQLWIFVLIGFRCLFVAFGAAGGVVDDAAVWDVAVPAFWGVDVNLVRGSIYGLCYVA